MPDYSKIPQEMKREKRWLAFMLVEKKENGQTKLKKLPVNPNNLFSGSSTDPTKWGDFETAVSCVGKISFAYKEPGKVVGIGFVLGGGWAGLDLDGSEGHDAGGFTPEVLQDINDTLKTYTEISVSGGGYHFIGRYSEQAPHIGARPSGSPIEIYTDGRYFATTGNQWGNYTAVADITEPLQAIRDKYFGKPKRRKQQRKRQRRN